MPRPQLHWRPGAPFLPSHLADAGEETQAPLPSWALGQGPFPTAHSLSVAQLLGWPGTIT